MATNTYKYYAFLICLVFVLAGCNLPSTPTAPVVDNTPTDSVRTAILATATAGLPTSTEAAPSTMTDPIVPPDSLTDTQWILVYYREAGAEKPAVEGTEVTLNFQADGSIGGSAGCNTYFSDYETQDGTISFGMIGQTEIYCMAEGVMDQEQLYLEALQNADDFQVDGDALVIHSAGDVDELHFIRQGSTATETPLSDLLCSISGVGTYQDWNLCRSQAYEFEFQHPATALMTDHTPNSARIDLPFDENTNLTEKYLQVTVTEDAGLCYSPLAEGYPPEAIEQDTVQLGGLTFKKQAGREGAVGSIYSWEGYSISQNGTCVSFGFVLHSHHPELYPTPPAEYDPEAETAIYSEIVSTFKWLNPPDSVTDTPTITPTPTVEPTPAPERINFASGATSATVSGSLAPQGMDAYVLRILAGQTLQVDLSFDQGEAILIIWGKDGTVMISDHAGATQFTGKVPITQDYFIHVRGNPDTETEYEMVVTIPPLTNAQPTPQPKRIQFETGATSATVRGHLPASGSDLFVLYAMKGQTMTIETDFSQGKAVLSVWGDNGTVLLSDGAEASEFEGKLPASQNYYILLKGRSGGPTDYEMEVTIPPK